MENHSQPTTEPAPLTSIKESQRFLGGVARSTLYHLLELGEIKSVSLRARGNIRGRRMILRESLEDYVERLKASIN
jgi:hypothetical protein